MSETKAKTGERAGWIKRNLKKDVHNRGGELPSSGMMKLVGELGGLVGGPTYKALPDTLQTGLSGPVHKMIDQQNEQGTRQALDTFKQRLPETAKKYYEQQRNLLAKDEQLARAIGDNPTYLTAARNTYTASAKVATDAAIASDYATAITALPQLRIDLKNALTLAKRAKVEASTTAKCTQIKNELDATVKVKGVDTPVRNAVGTKEWKSAVDKIVSSKLDDEFMERYNTVCDEVIDKLSKDPIVQNAAKNWKTWTKDFKANETEIKKAMQQILKLQSEQLGWPTPTATPYDVDDGDEGSFEGDPYPPGSLKVNFTTDGSKDFRELMDTLTHENTHAYQEKLIRDLRAGTIKPGDPDFAAATMLEMNDTRGTKGYINGQKSGSYKKLSPDYAYKKQPCEAHAWGAGRKIGRTTFKNLKKLK